MKFETIVILKPTLKYTDALEVKENIASYVNITSYEEWGIRKLAYKIKNYDSGIYLIINFSSTETDKDKLQDYYEQEKRIIKNIIVRKEC